MKNYSNLDNDQLKERLESAARNRLDNKSIIIAKKKYKRNEPAKVMYHARSYDYNNWIIRDVQITHKNNTMTKEEMILFFNKLLDKGYIISII